MKTSFEQIQKFFVQKYNLNIHKLTPETKLKDDLGFYGDDIDDILNEFCVHFQIKNLDFNLNNFELGQEPFALFSGIKNLFSKTAQKPQMTLGDFEKILLKHKKCSF